jgi:predicted peptidase
MYQEASFYRTITKTVGYRYLTWLPNEYAEQTSLRWPLLLFLHGGGERGDDLKKLLGHGPPRMLEGGLRLPFIVIAPQCPLDQDWSTDALSALLDEAEARYRVDPARIYLTGLSRGGTGVVDLAMACPERFAAIAPVAAAPNASLAWRIPKVPAWFFHGKKDPLVPVQSTEIAVRRLKHLGGSPRMTIYPKVGHDAWTATYANRELYSWLAAQSRTLSVTSSA